MNVVAVDTAVHHYILRDKAAARAGLFVAADPSAGLATSVISAALAASGQLMLVPARPSMWAKLALLLTDRKGRR